MCRDFQCHKLSAGSQQCSCCLEPFPNALESGNGAPVLPGSLVASAGLSCVSLLSQLPAMHAVHFIFQTALIPEECFLFQTSPFLCDKETYFFFFCLPDYVAYILRRVISLILLQYADSTIIISLDSCSLEF